MIVALALLARLTAGAEVCGRVPDCVIDVGRACAKKHLPSRNERAAAAKVVAARNSHQAPTGGAVFQDGRGARPLTSESMLFVQSVSKKFVRKASSTLAAVRH